MKLQAVFLPITLSLALSACVVTPPTPVPSQPSCGARQYGVLVGQPSTVLRTMKFDGPVRIIRPGMAVTQDYNGKRINFDVNRNGVIKSVRCG